MDRKKIIEKLYRALAAEPFEYGVSPELQEQTETVVKPTTTNVSSNVICTGTIQNPNGTTTPYAITERDIIEATFCGEAAECTDEQRKAIMAVAFNRNKQSPRSVTRGAFTFSGVAAELVDFDERTGFGQFSCWNDVYFSTCDGLRDGIARNRAKCSPNTVIPTLEHESLLQSLVNLGFNGSRDKSAPNYDLTMDPTKVFMYATPAAISNKSSWHPCLTGITITTGSKIDLVHEEYEVILDKRKNPTKNCYHFTNIKCALISDGCHAFLSNNGERWRAKPEKRTVKCPDLQPPIKPGKRRRICISNSTQMQTTPQTN